MIAIVDDEPDIVYILQSIAERAGYVAKGFTDPGDALDYFRKNCGSCALVITDIRMPSTTGFELAREIRKVNPTIKIIFMTAFEINKSEFEKMFPSTRIDRIIKKPFPASMFLQTIKDTLA